MHPLLSWDIISDRQVEQEMKAIKPLMDLKKRYQWNINMAALLKNEFDAIVVTDREEKIIWTSKGFELMTGYKRSFAKSKKPSFLQGINTDLKSKQRIREAINGRYSITERIINYRKNREEYLCQVEVIPLYNFENTLTHFIALEMEVES